MLLNIYLQYFTYNDVFFNNTEETDVYCLCRQGEFGMMVGCDNKDCPAQWFHLQCVGLKAGPRSKQWFCPLCING